MISEPVKEPYIKRLERQRDVLIEAMKSVDAYHAAIARANNTGYPGDAAKALTVTKKAMEQAVNEAKNTLGGLYV